MSISAASFPASNAGHSTLVSAGVSIPANCDAVIATSEKSDGNVNARVPRRREQTRELPPVVTINL